jgi:hypothetical protein
MIFAHAARGGNLRSAAWHRDAMMAQTETTLPDKKWHQKTGAIFIYLA